jgi:hypothetical protein
LATGRFIDGETTPGPKHTSTGSSSPTRRPGPPAGRMFCRRCSLGSGSGRHSNVGRRGGAIDEYLRRRPGSDIP